MVKILDQDTIAAVSTPSGYGGVGIIRISGSTAHSVASKMTSLQTVPIRQAVYTKFYDKQRCVLDSGLILRFDAPKSFTGEDMLELHAHGNPVVLALLLETLVSHGIRLALPGEFSRRAFNNNKASLLELEAVSALIQSTSRREVYAAQRVLTGKVSQEINKIKEKIKALRVLVEAMIDFSDEEIETTQSKQIRKQTDEILNLVLQLRKGAEEGMRLSAGSEIVIVGRPNAGKSTLSNHLVQKDVSIVSEKPGTTRDIIRNSTILNGISLNLVDTAGLRIGSSKDPIENEGIKRTKKVVKSADIVAIIVDISLNDSKTKENTKEIIKDLCKETDCPKIIVFNKVDLVSESKDVQNDFAYPSVVVSAETGQGISSLKDMIQKTLGINDASEDAFVARQRHVVVLDKMIGSLHSAQEQVDALELFSEELRIAQQELETLTGETTTEDLLGDIFSSFCIGK